MAKQSDSSRKATTGSKPAQPAEQSTKSSSRRTETAPTSESTSSRSTKSSSSRSSTTTTGSASTRSSKPASSRSAVSTPATSSTRKRTTAAAKKTTQTETPARDVRLHPTLKAFLEDPDALRNLKNYLPNWIDEVLAFLLIALGAVSFATLFSNGAEGEVSRRMSEMLRQGFGNGAPVIAAAILIGGLLILLPKIGIRIIFSWGRIVALELCFVCFQGILHLMAVESEYRALAREGGGGGYVGWAMSVLLTAVLSETFALVVLGIGLFIGLHWLLQIRRHHYRQGFYWVSDRIQVLASRLEAMQPQTQPAGVPREMAIPQYGTITFSEMEPEQPSEPPILMPAPKLVREARSAPAARQELPNDNIPIRAEVSNTVPVPAENNEEQPIADEAGVEERPALVLNGQVIGASLLARERQSIVPRNNGDEYQPAVMAPPSQIGKHYSTGRDNNPSKRYFTIQDMQERVKIGERKELLPPLELLGRYDKQRPSEEEINKNASIIENTLLEFDIDADVIDVKVGPVVTQYAVSPIKEVINPETREREIKRVRVDRFLSLQNDLAMALSAKTLRIEAPVPGHSYIGIEVPNRQATTVGLRGVLEAESSYNFRKRKSTLAIPLGRDVSGEPISIDLAEMPHLLIAGTTGSGKSVCLTSIVTSLVMNNTPDEIKLIMLDPKRVELTRFNGVPHLLGPVETEAERIIGVLRWTAREMDRRYKLLELENARNIDAYNATLGRRRKEEHLPYMVLLFDEIGDLMMSHPDETESTVTRLAQKARAAGIHLVIATQRPSTDILTGLIKANFPGRISFAVASGVDSRVILDYIGAETLLGRGDMLYLAPDAAGPKRVQGCYLSDEEVEEVTMYWRGWYEEQIAESKMERPGTPPWERGMTRLEVLSEQDPMLEDAITLVCESGEASTSLIQRQLGIGYPRAARLMDLLQELGVIGPPKSGGRSREVLVRNYKEALKHLKRNR